MKTIDVINATMEYVEYLRKHLKNVERAWWHLQEACEGMDFLEDKYIMTALQRDIDVHDMSKLYEHEFTQSRQYFFRPMVRENAP